jgi:hypothetical protein
MLSPGNVKAFARALAEIPRGSAIVEVGSFAGLSTNTISYIKRKAGISNPFFTCDPWLFEGGERQDNPLSPHTGVTHRAYREFVRDTFIRNVRMFSGEDLPFTLELTSDEFFDGWRAGRQATDVSGRDITLGGPIGFCYIDGHHSYEYARRDFEACDEFLVAGGLLLFDDSADESGHQVARVAEEVRGLAPYRVVSANPNYFFRKCAPAHLAP